MNKNIARFGAVTALVVAAAAGLTACSAATPTPAPTASPSSSASPSNSPSIPCNPDVPAFGDNQPREIHIPIPPNPAEIYEVGPDPAIAYVDVPAGTSSQWTAEITSVDSGNGAFDPCATVYFTPGSGGDTAIAPQLIPKGIGLNQVVLTNSVSGESYTFKVNATHIDAN